MAKNPTLLAPLKLHYLRWLLFPINGETYFMYQGIFDTEFDKYTDDAVGLFSATGVNTVFENLEGFPIGLGDQSRRVRRICPRTSGPELHGIR